MEGVPALLIIISLLIGNEKLFDLSSSVLSSVYLLGSWYLFKGDKYRVQDITLIMFSVFVIFLLVAPFLLSEIGFLTDRTDILTESWFWIIPSLWMIWYLYYRNRPFEWRLSLKLLSRIIVGFLLLAFI